jgi:hypothetical protein
MVKTIGIGQTATAAQVKTLTHKLYDGHNSRKSVTLHTPFRPPYLSHTLRVANNHAACARNNGYTAHTSRSNHTHTTT